MLLALPTRVRKAQFSPFIMEARGHPTKHPKTPAPYIVKSREGKEVRSTQKKCLLSELGGGIGESRANKAVRASMLALIPGMI
jgi:hypothetical protein